jgi:hypothetical protein
MSGLTGAFTEESLRMSLHRRLVVKYQNEADTVLIDELGLCQGSARVDLAVVNGQFHGYEIKSERDSLRRLGAQADLYSRVFDRVTLILPLSLGCNYNCKFVDLAIRPCQEPFL